MWSESGMNANDLIDRTETQSPNVMESSAKNQNRHTPSQDSCCSNDTLFNLEELGGAQINEDFDTINKTISYLESIEKGKDLKEFSDLRYEPINGDLRNESINIDLRHSNDLRNKAIIDDLSHSINDPRNIINKEPINNQTNTLIDYNQSINTQGEFSHEPKTEGVTNESIDVDESNKPNETGISSKFNLFNESCDHRLTENCDNRSLENFSMASFDNTSLENTSLENGSLDKTVIYNEDFLNSVDMSINSEHYESLDKSGDSENYNKTYTINSDDDHMLNMEKIANENFDDMNENIEEVRISENSYATNGKCRRKRKCERSGDKEQDSNTERNMDMCSANWGETAKKFEDMKQLLVCTENLNESSSASTVTLSPNNCFTESISDDTKGSSTNATFDINNTDSSQTLPPTENSLKEDTTNNLKEDSKNSLEEDSQNSLGNSSGKEQNLDRDDQPPRQVENKALPKLCAAKDSLDLVKNKIDGEGTNILNDLREEYATENSRRFIAVENDNTSSYENNKKTPQQIPDDDCSEKENQQLNSKTTNQSNLENKRRNFGNSNNSHFNTEIDQTGNETYSNQIVDRDFLHRKNIVNNFLTNERNTSFCDSRGNSKEDEASSSESYKTLSENSYSVSNIAPLNSPEDRQWKELVEPFLARSKVS